MSDKLEIVALSKNEIDSMNEEDIQSELFFISYKQMLMMEKQLKAYKSMFTSKVTELMLERLNRALENGFTDGNISNQYGKVTYVIGKLGMEEYFDIDMFRFENPELYQKYLRKRPKETSDQIRITPSRRL